MGGMHSAQKLTDRELSWLTVSLISEPPKDTGGDQISNYILEMDDGKG